MITGDSILNLIGSKDRKPWDYTGLKYTQQQKGVGLYSLCASCNNDTGSYYGNEYFKLATAFHQGIYNNDFKPNEVLNWTISNISPLKFAKQVLSMFCSTYDTFTLNMPEIKDLILNRDKKGVDTTKIKLYMFLLKEPRIAYTGINALGNLTGFIRLVTQVDAYPFGFVLEIDPKDKPIEDLLDITYFLNDFNIKDKPTLSITIPIKERNTFFPIDFRSKNEIEKSIQDNQEKARKLKEKK